MTERWVKQATKAATDGWSGDAWAVSISDTVTLLARQHRAFERMVKGCQCDPEDGSAVRNGYNQAKADILAAMAKQGGGKK